jgi:hypothetical protein
MRATVPSAFIAMRHQDDGGDMADASWDDCADWASLLAVEPNIGGSHERI